MAKTTKKAAPKKAAPAKKAPAAPKAAAAAPVAKGSYVGTCSNAEVFRNAEGVSATKNGKEIKTKTYMRMKIALRRTK
jgi:hypothetical protein